MERIKQLLEQQGKQASDAAIQAKIDEYGLDASSVTEAEAKVIVQELVPTAQPISGLTVGTNNKPTNTAPKQSKGRKNAKTVTFKDALVHAAKETESELTNVEDTIRQQKVKYVAQRANSLVAEIRNTSTEIVEAVTDRLMEEEADAETFLQIGTAFAEGLFPLS